MSIRVTCSFCGKQIKAKDSAAGKKAKCPDCGGVIKIPNLDEEEIYDAESTGEDDPFGFDDFEPNEGESIPSAKRKACPSCGEDIAKSASKCRFCGEIFDPALKAKAKREAKKNRKKDNAYVDEDMTTGDWVVAALCSGIGCIAGIVWMIQGKPKGGKMVLVSIGFAVLWNVISAVIRALNQN
ncbi:hypothetical protein Pan241w_17570 [Gimesia alba]|uniref:Double zinc ribbon n=1 Tax=Gimesia alba TaxID=2527973 RepID=A0A517RCY4_9PLAN|nr:hypothetical protein [Gimesia alba]QDT41694.1 hypothetical protein Pan241w_17570 [Gimesia alba]